MQRSRASVPTLLLTVGALMMAQCSGGNSPGTVGGSSSSSGSGGSSGTSSSGSSSGSGGSSGASSSGSSSGASSSGGLGSSGASSSSSSSGGPLGDAGNPDGSCSAGVPAQGHAADTSNPTTVVGEGTAASCTPSQLVSAVALGGVITFNCGPAPVTIPISATLNLPTDRTTVIDGGNLITLDGKNGTQILRFDHEDFMVNTNGITLQHITLINGKTTPTQLIPVAPAPCSQGYDDGEGGALYVRDGTVRIIDVIFQNNQAALLGPDTGGGAVYILGSLPAYIVGSTFRNNSASNGGGLGTLFVDLHVYNCLFEGNIATGNGANSDDASECSVINNGQNEVGSGGNGGALYNDGASPTNVTVCGTEIVNNAAGTGGFGGAIFYTSNDFSGTLTISDSTITGNTGGSWGGAGTGVGVNAKAIVISNSTVQGHP